MRCKDVVEAVLARRPETRADHRLLMFRVWELQGLELTREQWAVVEELFQPETIRRTRAKLQNEEGRFLPLASESAGTQTFSRLTGGW
jgi:hypothetical protein